MISQAKKTLFLKFNRLLMVLFLSMFFVVSQGSSLWAAEKCEFIEVDKSRPLFQKMITSREYDAYLDTIPKKLSESERKGVLGEVVARDYMEQNIRMNGRRLVSITTLFNKNNCSVEEYIRDKGGRGFDDIFVALGADGWIDRTSRPIFHEAKYDGRCNIKLKNTVTLCTQLSFQWLDGNLTKAYKRTRAGLCYGGTEIIVKSCLACKTKFQESVIWLASMLQNRNFNRTASLLCANGQLSIYNVNGS